jgi:predicted 3-demethylubiquinone-9 3-methyltransferase (glyoxalase superfamily)
VFTFTPAISFFVTCATAEEVDDSWAWLSPGGGVLMPLDAYPFSARYGWTTDRYGLSWQISLAGEGHESARITPMLLFVGDVAGKAEEAITFYASVFPDSKVGSIMRHGPGEEPEQEGTIKFASFALQGEEFAAMDSALDHQFGFNEAISFMVNCENQDEIDRYWAALSAVPEAEQCGWLKDRFGLSWQVTPVAMNEMLTKGSTEQIARVVDTFMPMKKLDLAALERAYEGS